MTFAKKAASQIDGLGHAYQMDLTHHEANVLSMAVSHYVTAIDMPGVSEELLRNLDDMLRGIQGVLDDAA